METNHTLFELSDDKKTLISIKKELKDTITAIIVPDGITNIKDNAFAFCYNLESITIPRSVKYIGEEAFGFCPLKAIIIEKGNPIYDSRDNCNAIIETRSNKLVLGCSNTIIPDSVISIGDYAFNGCSDLESITIPTSVKYIGEEAFCFCSLQVITVKKGNPIYDSRDNCNAIIETRSNKLIVGCDNTIIPDSVISIGDYAFQGCELDSITIPNSIISIGKEVFAYCSLNKISVEHGNPTYDSRDNCNAIIETRSNKLVVGCCNTIIPDSVTSIGDYAFQQCEFKSITIPECVTSIGESAFSGCDFLHSITIPNSVINIGDSAFRYCSSLKSIVISNSVAHIGGWAFSWCESLSSVTIHSSSIEIDIYAFDQCQNIKEFIVPKGSKMQFSQMKSLKPIRNLIKETCDHEVYSQKIVHKRSCPSCGKSLSSDFTFCPYCGAAQSKKCSVCDSTNIPTEALYCPDCGSKL